jgi:hypothetical protein
LAADEGGVDGHAHRPHPDAEQRNIHGASHTGALAIEECGRNATGDSHATDRITASRPGLGNNPV